jgi:hypothetical protein
MEHNQMQHRITGQPGSSIRLAIQRPILAKAAMVFTEGFKMPEVSNRPERGQPPVAQDNMATRFFQSELPRRDLLGHGVRLAGASDLRRTAVLNEAECKAILGGNSLRLFPRLAALYR